MSVLGDTVSTIFGGGSKPSRPEMNSAADMIDAEAKANRVNTYTPWGSTIFDQGDDGRWTANVNLSPELQQAFQRQSEMAMGSPDTELRDMPEYGGQQYQDLEQALFDRQMALLEPQADKRMASFEQSMYDRGMPSGSEAYDADYANLTDAINRQRERAALDAVVGARGAFVEDRGFTNQLNQQDRQYDLTTDQLDYNQLAALLTRAPSASVAPINAMGAYQAENSNRMNDYMLGLDQYNQGWANFGDLGSTATMFAMGGG